MKKILSKLSLPIFQFLFIIGVSFLLPQLDLVAFAAPTAAQTALSSTEYLTELVTFLSTGLQLVQQLLWPILLLIGPLLDNNLIFGPGVEDRLFEIWSQMRNITSLILAIMLVGVALANIFGVSDGSSYEIKSFLKKMVITLVVINFTFFGARIILDASNVLTNFAFGLPNTVQTQSISSLQNIEKGLCSALRQVGASAESNVFEGMLNLGLANEGSQGMCDQNSLTPAAKGFFSRISSSNLSMIMAANYSTIADGLEPSRTFQATLDIVNLSINTALSLIMVLLHALAYISLFFILVIRLMFLWLSIALSPLIVFATIMGLSQFDELKGLYDEFFTHVFAPVKVGFALSISYIIFSTIEQTGISTPGMVLGQGLSYPFSGVGTLEKLIISLSSAIIVFEVALSVGSKTRASFITDSISQFAKTNARKGQSFLKRIPLGYAGKGNSPISISSLSKNWENLVNTTETATGGTPTTTKPEVKNVIRAIKDRSPSAKLTQAEFRNFVDNRTDPAILAGVTVQEVLDKTQGKSYNGGLSRYRSELARWATSNSRKVNSSTSIQDSNGDPGIGTKPFN
jgi:hypothetical protein